MPHRIRQIHCNRDLNMTRVRWIGFDMDYTLAIYRREALDALVHRLALQRLADDGRWRADIADIPFDPDFAIRGLVLDKHEGNLLKMDRYHHVGAGYHGFRQLDDPTRRLYRHDPPLLGSKRFQLLDTLFELPEAYLFCAIIDHHERHGLRIDYGELADALRETIDALHGDGALKEQIVADLPGYLHPDPRLASTLHRFRSAGKRLFLMTNSYASFTETVMTWLLGESRNEYPSWRQYFDIIITGANKPHFFGRGTDFIEVDAQENVVTAQVPRLLPGRLYQGGRITDLERTIGLTGDAILYVGDHIYGDILRSKRDSLWRTCMVIPELDAEIRHIQANAEAIRSWDGLEKEFFDLNRRLSNALNAPLLAASEGQEAPPPPGSPNGPTSILALRRAQKRLLRRLLDHERRVEARFHPRWGALLRQGNTLSILGQQVDAYACLYTSRVSNFVDASPERYWLSPRTFLPHELAYHDGATEAPD